MHAAITQADPAGAAQAAAAAAQERFVRLGRASEHGLKMIIARASAGSLPAGHTPVDAYEIPASLREQILLRNPADVFPYAAALTRRIDIDHTNPYLSPERGGPPGQTRIGNLGPHCRRHHNLKTHGGWQVRQPEPGTWVWRSPHKHIYLINNTGTHPLGDTPYAQTIWRAASSPPQTGKLTMVSTIQQR